MSIALHLCSSAEECTCSAPFLCSGHEMQGMTCPSPRFFVTVPYSQKNDIFIALLFSYTASLTGKCNFHSRTLTLRCITSTVILWPVWPPRTIKCNGNNNDNSSQGNDTWLFYARSRPQCWWWGEGGEHWGCGGDIMLQRSRDSGHSWEPPRVCQPASDLV
jgi:hypothetical protein